MVSEKTPAPEAKDDQAAAGMGTGPDVFFLLMDNLAAGIGGALFARSRE